METVWDLAGTSATTARCSSATTIPVGLAVLYDALDQTVCHELAKERCT
ncbi:MULTISPECIES: hypothetical protein [Pseudonocardia]|nr:MULTISPECIES: hypothetical protein [Pseudonocardia]